jgi:hypothetical protein
MFQKVLIFSGIFWKKTGYQGYKKMPKNAK